MVNQNDTESGVRMGKAGNIALMGTTALCLVVTTGLMTYILTRPDQPAQFSSGQPYPMQQYSGQGQFQPQYQAPQYPAQMQPQFQPQMQVQQFPQQMQPQQIQPAAQGTIPANPQIASSAKDIINIVSKLDGFVDDSGRTEANAGLPPIQIFFDPRCPYCHKLYDNIAGKAPIHWIPISALAPQDGGINSGATIIQAEKDKPGVGGKEAMRAAFDKKLTPIPATDAHKASLEQNLGSFVLMAKTLPPTVQAGVPFALIPKKDGTFETHVGYSDGDESTIMGSYGK